MLILGSSSDILRLVTGQAGAIGVHASWVDNDAGAITPGRTNTVITTATTTTVVGNPTGSIKRTVPTLIINNQHASDPCDITLQIYDGSNSINLQKKRLLAGEVVSWVDGIGLVSLDANGALKEASAPILFKYLNADDTGGQNVSTAQPWFPTAGALAVDPGLYAFEGQLFLTRSAGGTSHTTGVLFGGTATIADAQWNAGANTGNTNALGATNEFMSLSNAEHVIKAASTNTTENIWAFMSGHVRISAAGTLIPQFKYSAAPGGAPTIKEGTWFRAWRIGEHTATQAGTWS